MVTQASTAHPDRGNIRYIKFFFTEECRNPEQYLDYDVCADVTEESCLDPVAGQLLVEFCPEQCVCGQYVGCNTNTDSHRHIRMDSHTHTHTYVYGNRRLCIKCFL